MARARRIAFVTTARSDYNTMFPVMRQAVQDPDVTALIFCAGMHTVAAFGNTWQQLEQDGLKIDALVEFLNDSDDNAVFAKEMARGVTGFTDALVKHRPDIVCVSGDRLENMPLYVAATSLRIPIAHMCGGDITEGAIDNQIRHMMTKLSHLHFVSMPEHARRVIQMGEEPWRVILTGDAAIDVIVQTPKLDRSVVEKELGLAPDERFVLTTYHPQTLGGDTDKDQYRTLLDALAGIPERIVMIYPNIDPGFQSLVEMLESFPKRRPDVIQRKSFDRGMFYGMMHHADFMIGNSSSGLWEAPSFALPAINIGERQAGRVRGENVIDVSGLDAHQLGQALTQARDPAFRRSLKGMKNPFGSGQASALTVDTLRTIPIDEKLMFKKFHEIEFDPLELDMNKGNL